jgi:hypothetical protein
MDEVVIFNDDLTASQIKDLYRPVGGNYTWNVNITDNAGNSVLSDTRTFTINRAPITESVTIGPVGVNTTTQLNCTFNVTDDIESFVDVNVTFYKDDLINSTVLVSDVSSGVETVQSVAPYTHSRGQDWLCSVFGIDDVSSGSPVNSSSIEISNIGPGQPNLTSPASGTETTDRTPTFIWYPGNEYGLLPPSSYGGDCGETFFCGGNTSDPDRDSVEYIINITCVETGGGTCNDNREITVNENQTNCESNGNGFFDSSDNCTHTLDTDLVFFGDDGYFYNWTVTANDVVGLGVGGSVYGISSSAVQLHKFNITPIVLIGMSLLNSSANFGDVVPGTSEDTSSCSLPTGNLNDCPILVENVGNALADVNITGPSSAFWSSVTFPHTSDYFSAKIGNGSQSGQVSYNASESITTYTALPASGVNTTFVKSFNNKNSNDEFRIDVNITVPTQEPKGNKDVDILLTGWYVGI